MIIMFFLLFVFAVSSVSAVPCSSPSQTILRLSTETNAHGEVYNGAGSYPVEICYNTLFGKEYTGNTPHTCSGNNANIVLKLNSETNAHAESPTLNNYNTNVCYGDLSCTLRDNSCLAGETAVVSLSSQTNAHLALGNAAFTKKICCESAVVSGPVCGNGKIEEGEQCERGISCSAGLFCTAKCKCVSELDITNALWIDTDTNEIVYGRAIDKLIEPATLYGESLYPKGTELLIDVFDVTDSRRAKFSEVVDTIDDGSVAYTDKLENVLGTEVGDKFYFVINNLADDKKRKSNNLSILEAGEEDRSFVGKCENFKTSETCNKALFEGSAPAENLCEGKKTNKCVWEDGICKYEEKVFAPKGEVAGICKSYYTDEGECINGERIVNVKTEYTAGTCSKEDASCVPKESVTIPCGRAVLELPFFGMWQAIAAIIIIAILYVIIFRTKLFEKETGKGKKKK